MPIFVKRGASVDQYTVDQLKGELERRPLHFAGVIPANLQSLIDQLLTRYDFGNRRFISFDALQQQIVADAMEEATDIRIAQGQEPVTLMGLDKDQWKRAPFQSQFKAMSIAKIGEMSFLAMQSKNGEGLAKEASLLRQLECMGLRTVPVYGSADKCMFQRCISGSFMDLYKQDLTCIAAKCKLNMLQLSILSAFADIAMPSGEAAVMGMFRFEAKLRATLENTPIAPTCITTALCDFAKIRELMQVGIRIENDRGDIEHVKIYVSDLQGVLEAKTGKFFIIDPLAIKMRSDAHEGEEHLIANAEKNLDAITEFLSGLLAPTPHAKPASQPIPKLPPPPK